MLSLNIDFSTVITKLKSISPSKIKKAYKIALLTVAEEINKVTKDGVPNDTGELLKSWEVWELEDSVEAGYNIIYAMYQHQGRREDGTHIIRNRPAGGRTYFLKLGIDENRDKLFDLYEQTFITELLK